MNTAEALDGDDIADLILEDEKTVLVIENYYTSSGHGHSYDGYLSFGQREGKRSVVVLLCVTGNSAEQIDGWEEASVVTYSSSYGDWWTTLSAMSTTSGIALPSIHSLIRCTSGS